MRRLLGQKSDFSPFTKRTFKQLVNVLKYNKRIIKK